MFIVPDLDERFNSYPDYQEKLQVIHSLSSWVSDFPGDIYIKRLSHDRVQTFIPVYARALAEEYSNMDPQNISTFFNAIAVAQLFRLLDIPIPFSKELAVPGHFVSQLPVLDVKTKFYLLRKYAHQPPTTCDFETVLQNLLYLNRDALQQLGVVDSFATERDRKFVVVAFVNPKEFHDEASRRELLCENISQLLRKTIEPVEFDFTVALQISN